MSSSLGESLDIAGRRFGHVIDPRSGWPVSEPRQTVVVAYDGGMAEALSTALLVLDPEAGLELIESLPRIEALWIDASGMRTTSSGFAAAVDFAPATGP